MKFLGKSHFKYKAEKLFDMSLNSVSGCNVKVGDKYYNLYVNTKGEYVVTEFKPEFELSEEEFEKLNTKK